ncbi:hypothetical protein CYFUS_001695 [Cystobacter fuscus]|uniref:Uncharacterized protein n=1 Tax=Cystobacter fuscus TaxID=43 RepID=A0A250IYP3_9BACT|nr:hypothetical protein [Cystobacter fuscus]ATB36281.1 hypothetical protein CYFUS_001695 [Cystobacter fuscus]
MQGFAREVLWWLGGFMAAVLVYGVVVLTDAGFRQGERVDRNEKTASGVPLDFNNNGVPDFQESWFWRGVWRGAALLVKTFAKPHTVAYRAVVAAEEYERQARGELH